MKDKKLGNGEMGEVVNNFTHGVRKFRDFKTLPNLMHVLKHTLGQTRMNNE